MPVFHLVDLSSADGALPTFQQRLGSSPGHQKLLTAVPSVSQQSQRPFVSGAAKRRQTLPMPQKSKRAKTVDPAQKRALPLPIPLTQHFRRQYLPEPLPLTQTNLSPHRRSPFNSTLLRPDRFFRTQPPHPLPTPHGLYHMPKPRPKSRSHPTSLGFIPPPPSSFPPQPSPRVLQSPRIYIPKQPHYIPQRTSPIPAKRLRLSALPQDIPQPLRVSSLSPIWARQPPPVRHEFSHPLHHSPSALHFKSFGGVPPIPQSKKQSLSQQNVSVIDLS